MNLKERMEKLASLEYSGVEEGIKDFDSISECAVNLALKGGLWNDNPKVQNYLKDNFERIANSVYDNVVIPFLAKDVSRGIKADNAETLMKTFAAIIKVVHDEENLAEIQMSDILNKNYVEGMNLLFGTSRFSEDLKYYDKTKKIIEQKIFAGEDNGVKIGVRILFVPQVPQRPNRIYTTLVDVEAPMISRYSSTFNTHATVVADNALYYTILVSKDYEEYREKIKWELEVYLSRIMTDACFINCVLENNKITFRKDGWVSSYSAIPSCTTDNYAILREMATNILSGIVLSEVLDISDRKFVEILKDFYKEHYKYDIKYTRESNKRCDYGGSMYYSKKSDDIDVILSDELPNEDKEDADFFEYKFKLICTIIDMYYGINQ